MPHKFDDATTDDVLRHDSIAAMEQVTGKHWSEWDQRDQLGALGMAMRDNQAKARVLKSRDDNAFGDKLPEFERIAADIGFELVLEVPFTEPRGGRQEKLKAWWLAVDGILLVYDTYSGQESVNSGNFFYNWREHPGNKEWVTSSSSPCGDGIIAGGHDCREAMRRNIDRLRACGEFIVPWRSAKCVYLSLTHFADDLDRDAPLESRMSARKAIGLERAKMLPAEVQKATGLVERFSAAG